MVTTDYSPDDLLLMQKYPELKRLVELRDGGRWSLQWQQIRADRGLLTGFRLWPGGWNDAFAVLDVDDAKAFRCDGDGGEVWGVEGSLTDVLDGLAVLPHPLAANAPRLVRARAPELWTP
jgi:hypothetical protein